MILVRQVFQVKYGHMDPLLDMLEAVQDSDEDTGTLHRVLTDISGNNFTLVFESKAESLDAFWNSMQEMFQDSERMGRVDPMQEHIISGHREFYNIEWEAED